MSVRRTRFYLDKQNAKWKGVCAGIADYTGVDVVWVRLATVFSMFAVPFPMTLVAYLMTAWLANKKPRDLYVDQEDQQFWQGVRQSPARTTRDVKAKFRELDRRLADVELFYTTNNRALSNEIEKLR